MRCKVGVFIQITVNESWMTPEVVQSMASLCPVDIFDRDGERLTVRTDQEDECTLCELCLNVAPVGAITIHKTYNDERLISRGGVLNLSKE